MSDHEELQAALDQNPRLAAAVVPAGAAAATAAVATAANATAATTAAAVAAAVAIACHPTVHRALQAALRKEVKNHRGGDHE